MTLLRGRGLGLEVMFAGRDFEEALVELRDRLAAQPEFYRGCAASAVFGDAVPDAASIDRLRDLLQAAGISYSGHALLNGELERRRALRPKRELKLSENAKTLIADFAGARADIAERRKRGESSVRRGHPAAAQAPVAKADAAVPAAPAPPPTLYHVGTLRGGQALHHPGNIVLIGDANPGTEIVATGDIVVFGRLLGVAHAGAQGDDRAKVYALSLHATQLRIASCIAADEGDGARASEPEAAVVRDGRIVIIPFEKAGELLV